MNEDTNQRDYQNDGLGLSAAYAANNNRRPSYDDGGRGSVGEGLTPLAPKRKNVNDMVGSAEVLAPSRNDKLLRYLNEFLERATKAYYKNVSYFAESILITVSLWISVISSILFCYSNGWVLPMQWESILIEIALILFALVGVYACFVVNQRHAALLVITQIQSGSAVFDTLVQFMKGNYHSRLLRIVFGLFQTVLIIVFSSITNLPTYSLSGNGLYNQLSLSMLPNLYLSSGNSLILAAFGNLFTCIGCEGVTTTNNILLAPISAVLQPNSQATSGEIQMQVFQDIIAISSSCATIATTSSITPISGNVLLTFTNPTMTNSSINPVTLNLFVTSQSASTGITTTRSCTVSTSDYYGQTISSYFISSNSQMRYAGVSSISSSSASNCLKVGAFCLLPAQRSFLSFSLLNQVFGGSATTFSFSQSYSLIFEVFPDPTSSLTDANYAIQFSKWIALLLKSSTSNYQFSASTCSILSNGNSVSIQLMPSLGYLLLTVTALISFIGSIYLARDLYRIRGFSNSLLRRLSVSTLRTKEQLEDLSEYFLSIGNLKNASGEPLLLGESPDTTSSNVGKLKFGRDHTTSIKPIEPGREYQ